MDYFKHAKSNCCHFQQTVIHNKDCMHTNYCWHTGVTCTMHPSIDMGCFYYVNIALPYDKKLAAQWRAENPPMGMFVPVATKVKKAPPKQANPTGFGFGVCGKCEKEFERKNNKQKNCDNCQPEIRKGQTQFATKKHRNKNT